MAVRLIFKLKFRSISAKKALLYSMAYFCGFQHCSLSPQMYPRHDKYRGDCCHPAVVPQPKGPSDRRCAISASTWWSKRERCILCSGGKPEQKPDKKPNFSIALQVVQVGNICPGYLFFQMYFSLFWYIPFLFSVKRCL